MSLPIIQTNLPMRIQRLCKMIQPYMQHMYHGLKTVAKRCIVLALDAQSNITGNI